MGSEENIPTAIPFENVSKSKKKVQKQLYWVKNQLFFLSCPRPDLHANFQESGLIERPSWYPPLSLLADKRPGTPGHFPAYKTKKKKNFFINLVDELEHFKHFIFF